jgi:phosphatidylserine decarboxylase
LRIPVAPEGWAFILPPAAAAVALASMGWWAAGVVAAVPALAFVGFFRDPERRPPRVAGALLAPADGRVTSIAEVEDGWVGPAVRIAIFLSPLDVHVNRSPATALVREVEYVHGTYHPAYRVERSEANERCTVSLESDSVRLAVRQVAGVLARRIVCRVRRGDKLEAGERFGMIRFGSRTDLIAPRRVDVRVSVGDRVRGGESVLAVLR